MLNRDQGRRRAPPAHLLLEH